MTASASAESTLMFTEARTANEFVAAQFDAIAGDVQAVIGEIARRDVRFVATCGRGSSDHAAMFAKYLIESRVGLPTLSFAPSVFSVYEKQVRLDDALFLTISQSGRSPDLVRCTERARESGAFVVALVNDASSPVAQAANVVIDMGAAEERSVAATKSMICTLSALVHLVGTWAEADELLVALRELPGQLREAFDCDWSPFVEGLVPARHAYVVGRGTGFAIALEAAIKLKETSALHAEAQSAAEVRHGPMVIVDKGFPILVFSQDDPSAVGTEALLRDLHAQGAELYVAGTEPAVGKRLPIVKTTQPELQPIVSLQSFYRAAAELAVRRGMSPDAPPHLTKVTETI